MAMNTNEIIVSGRLKEDPVLNVGETGNKVCTFTLANERNFKKSDTKRTNWFDVVTYKELAEICAKFTSKGKYVVVTGSMEQRSYMSKDEKKRYKWELRARNVEFGSNSVEKQIQLDRNEPTPPGMEDMEGSFTEIDDAELPF